MQKDLKLHNLGQALHSAKVKGDTKRAEKLKNKIVRTVNATAKEEEVKINWPEKVEPLWQ